MIDRLFTLYVYLYESVVFSQTDLEIHSGFFERRSML